MPVAEHATQTNGKANVSPGERLVSTAVGGVLAFKAVRKPSVANLAGALVAADLIYRGVSGHCHLYEALGLNTAAADKSGSHFDNDAPEVTRAITIGRPAEELYHFWRDPENLARIVKHFAEVTPQPDNITHWRVHGPLDQIVEWDSRCKEDIPGHKLSWESLPGSALPNSGEVSFAPGPNGIGTEVALRMRFEPPLGTLEMKLSRTLHLVPRAIAGKTLRNFKSLMETGEIPTLENNPSGRGESDNF